MELQFVMGALVGVQVAPESADRKIPPLHARPTVATIFVPSAEQAIDDQFVRGALVFHQLKAKAGLAIISTMDKVITKNQKEFDFEAPACSEGEFLLDFIYCGAACQSWWRASIVIHSNAPDHRCRASGVRPGTAAPLRHSVHPACWAFFSLIARLRRGGALDCRYVDRPSAKYLGRQSVFLG
jgi:hypothetical protein